MKKFLASIVLLLFVQIVVCSQSIKNYYLQELHSGRMNWEEFLGKVIAKDICATVAVAEQEGSENSIYFWFEDNSYFDIDAFSAKELSRMNFSEIPDSLDKTYILNRLQGKKSAFRQCIDTSQKAWMLYNGEFVHGTGYSDLKLFVSDLKPIQFKIEKLKK